MSNYIHQEYPKWVKGVLVQSQAEEEALGAAVPPAPPMPPAPPAVPSPPNPAAPLKKK